MAGSLLPKEEAGYGNNLSGYRCQNRRQYLYRRGRSGADRKIHPDQADHGANGDPQHPGSLPTGTGQGRTAPKRLRPHHHDLGAQIRAGGGGGDQSGRHRKNADPDDRFRRVYGGRGRGRRGKRRSPDGHHSLVRPRDPHDGGCGAGHPKGDGGPLLHRSGGHHRRHHHRHSPNRLHGCGTPGHL